MGAKGTLALPSTKEHTLANDLAIPFLRARYFNVANNRKIDLVVVHDMENPEEPDAAEKVARWFSGKTSPEASAHYCIDNNSIVQCVLNKDIAWHAPGANHNGVGIEHAGYASQRAEQWADPYSVAELELSARLTRMLCANYSIPIAYVDAAGLKAGRRGITTHNAVSLAFKRSTHTDPGPNFPMAHYIELVRGTPLDTVPTAQEVRLVVNAPVVTILSHAAWNGGYIQVGADGGTFSWAAPNFGSLGNVQLAAPIVDADVTPSGNGYTLLGADGGIFDFGDAAEAFEGGLGGTKLNMPCVAIKFTATGKGYWITARDGGVFTFGDARHKGNVQYSGG
jgi:N-acetyl-anhydromuramyl-L-alanine amidase AmpD